MEITYQVEQTDDFNFYLYVADKDLKKLQLDDEVLDEINSFGVSLDSRSYYLARQYSVSQRDVGEIICSRIAEMFSKIWGGTLGVPRFRFEGDLNKFGDLFKNRTVFIYFNMKDTDEDEQIEAYKEALSLCTKITFLPYSPSLIPLITKDHAFALSWLAQRKYDLRHARLQSDKYNIQKRMNDWYPLEPMRNAMVLQAKEIIDNFLLTKKLNLYVPDFLIVPSFHIRRYQKALSILTTLFEPIFIMPLPMVFQEKHQYTIMLPICKDIGRRAKHVVSVKCTPAISDEVSSSSHSPEGL